MDDRGGKLGARLCGHSQQDADPVGSQVLIWVNIIWDSKMSGAGGRACAEGDREREEK